MVFPQQLNRFVLYFPAINFATYFCTLHTPRTDFIDIFVLQLNSSSNRKVWPSMNTDDGPNHWWCPCKKKSHKQIVLVVVRFLILLGFCFPTNIGDYITITFWVFVLIFLDFICFFNFVPFFLWTFFSFGCSNSSLAYFIFFYITGFAGRILLLRILLKENWKFEYKIVIEKCKTFCGVAFVYFLFDFIGARRMMEGGGGRKVENRCCTIVKMTFSPLGCLSCSCFFFLLFQVVRWCWVAAATTAICFICIYLDDCLADSWTDWLAGSLSLPFFGWQLFSCFKFLCTILSLSHTHTQIDTQGDKMHCKLSSGWKHKSTCWKDVRPGTCCTAVVVAAVVVCQEKTWKNWQGSKEGYQYKCFGDLQRSTVYQLIDIRYFLWRVLLQSSGGVREGNGGETGSWTEGIEKYLPNKFLWSVYQALLSTSMDVRRNLGEVEKNGLDSK